MRVLVRLAVPPVAAGHGHRRGKGWVDDGPIYEVKAQFFKTLATGAHPRPRVLRDGERPVAELIPRWESRRRTSPSSSA